LRYYYVLLRARPNSYEAHEKIGIALEKQGQVGRAVEHYLKAIEINPDSAEAYDKLGILLMRQNRLPEATKCFREALKLKPNLQEARRNIESIEHKTFKSGANNVQE
jgi:protein O-GlcNAc transferase